MTIIAQPATLAASQNPLILDLEIIIANTGEPLRNAVVTVTNGTDTVVFRRGTDTEEVILFTRRATWRIDLRQVVQTFFRNTSLLSAFGDITTEYFDEDPLLVQTIDVSITYEKINLNGLLQDIGVTDTATQFKVINAGRQWGQTFSLLDYTQALGRKYLSNKPKRITICPDEADFLQFWSDGINVFTIETYDASDVLIATGVGDVSGFAAPATLVTVGTGIVNINNFTNWIGAPVVIDASVKRYRISFGVISIGFVRKTEWQQYEIIGCCENSSVRFFWLNRLGGVDAYTFTKVKVIEGEAKSDLYEKFASLDYAIPDYGLQKFNSSESELITCTSGILSNALTEWLRELQTSTRVYVQRGSDLYACVILDAKNVISDSNNPVIVREVTAQLSINKIIQNNI